jgi:hypothetical protein
MRRSNTTADYLSCSIDSIIKRVSMSQFEQGPPKAALGSHSTLPVAQGRRRSFEPHAAGSITGSVKLISKLASRAGRGCEPTGG